MLRNVVLLVSALFLVGLFWLTFTWLAWAGQPWTGWSTLLQQLEEEQRRDDLLQQQRQAALWNYQAKNQVMQELLHERISLLEAAAWFHQINSQSASIPMLVYPVAFGTPEEQACQQVLNWARTLLLVEASTQGKEQYRHLESEMKQQLSQQNGLVLPPLPTKLEIPPWPELS